jgi:His-Xaa-Ser system protein HxsD
MTSTFPQVRFDAERVTATISLSKQIYSTSAILRGCYWFSSDLACQLVENEDEFLLTIKPLLTKPSLDQPMVKSVEDWLPQIFNRLTDEELRVEVQRETASVRELIIAKAFAEAGILEDAPPGTFEDTVAVRNEKTNLVKISPQPSKLVE